MSVNKFVLKEDFRGQLSLRQQKDPEMYERLQYIKALSGIEQDR